MADYRIDELARRAGTTVRNVRAYQERGLLDPPRRQGRTGLYGDAHLVRLRLIADLLDRGYTLANIRELIDAWQEGKEIEHLLGLHPGGAGPLAGASVPARVTVDWLVGVFGPLVSADELPGALGAAVELGILEPDGDGFRVADERLLRAATELAAAGVPLAALTGHARELRRDVEVIAERFVDLVDVNVLQPHAAVLPGPEETARLAGIVQRLRPLADMVVLGELDRAIDREARRRLHAYVDSLLGDEAAAPDDDATGGQASA